jgi:hypothetical protein
VILHLEDCGGYTNLGLFKTRQIAAELDGMDGGRTVSKDNVAHWWNNKVKLLRAQQEPAENSNEKSDKTLNFVAASSECSENNIGSETSAKLVPAKEAKEAQTAASSSEKEARVAMLREELIGLGLIKLSGDTIPSFRPSASDMINDFDLNAIRSEETSTMSMKTRQVMARFLEGSARSIKDVAALLLGGAANKPSEDEEAECLAKIEECINVVAHLVERRPKISDGKVQADGTVKRWEVKDIADIPERFRALVDTHRKMEVSLCERIKLIQTLITELSSSKCKSTTKLDKHLLLMKDKHLKLEEKEKKERDKLEVKLEVDRKKQQQRDDKVKEAKSESKDLTWKAPEKADVKSTSRSKKIEPVKGSASSIMSFFGKGAAPKSAAPQPHSAGEDGNCATAVMQAAAPKERRNFHPWEQPKNAVVAPFPYGPAAKSKTATKSAVSADLAGWLAVLQSETVRIVRKRPLRDDGTPHPKMKLIQLNMKIPIVKTQLVDVDVEAEKKVTYSSSFCVLVINP